MTTVAALAMLLVHIPCTRLWGMVPAWQNLQQKDLVFFFEAREATLLVANGSSEENVVWT